MLDHRSVPVEVLRGFARTRNETVSIKAAALEAGIGRSTLHSFITGRTETPHPRVRRKLALWFLEKRDEPPDAEILRPYLAALAVLIGEFPEEDQEAARAVLVDDLCALHPEPLPRWLQRLKARQ